MLSLKKNEGTYVILYFSATRQTVGHSVFSRQLAKYVSFKLIVF